MRNTFKRKTLRTFSLYRRFSNGFLPTDARSMEEFHRYESLGVLPEGVANFTEFTKTNGFAFGKWQAKLTVDMIREDLINGYVCKAEFANSHHLKTVFKGWEAPFSYGRNNWFIYPQLVHVISADVF